MPILLERFFSPLMRVFDQNLKSLPGARLYFFDAGTSTPRVTYADKFGEIENSNPVIADASGSFPPIFLLGLYRVELRSSKNIVQPGWPIDNVGQDSSIVPFGEWSEVYTYPQGYPVIYDGNWYRSKADNNLGNEPDESPDEWEIVIVPSASSFTSNVDYVSFSDDGLQVSVDIDEAGLVDSVSEGLDSVDGDFSVAGSISSGGNITTPQGVVVFANSAFKSSGTNRASTTTYAADPDLSFVIPAGITGQFKFDALIQWTGGASTTNGIKLRVIPSASFSGMYIASRNTALSTTNTYPPVATTRIGSSDSGIHLLPAVAGGTESILISGFISVTSGQTVAIEWAQDSFNATATSVLAGSYISISRIG